MVGIKPSADNQQILDYVGTWVYNKRGCHCEIHCSSDGKLILEDLSSSGSAAAELYPVGGGWLEARLQGGGCVQFLRSGEDGRMFAVWRDSESSTWSSTAVARLFPPRKASSSTSGTQKSASTERVTQPVSALLSAPPGLTEPVRDADTFVDGLLIACAMTESVAKAKVLQPIDLEETCNCYPQRPVSSCGLWSNESWSSSSSEYSVISSGCMSAPRSNEFGEWFTP